MTGSVVPLHEVLHLKTGINYLENNTMLVAGEFADAVKNPNFQKYTLLEVSEDESYAVNSVWINGTILTPKGFPKVKELLVNAGFKIRDIDVSEY